MTAGKHAETYMKLLRAIKDKRKLKLTPSATTQHWRAAPLASLPLFLPP